MYISIIVPVYNAEKKIKETIESILNQISTECEIILINDGSIDDSGKICDLYDKKNKNIRVIHQRNSGPSTARNRGITEAKGDFITFVDADDQLDKSWFSNINSIIKKDNPDLIISGYKNFRVRNSGAGGIENFIPKPDVVHGRENILLLIPYLIEEKIFNPLWNKVYRTKFIKEKKMELNPKYKLGEDFLFNLEYLGSIEKVILLDKALYHYITNDNSLTESYTADKFSKLKPVTLEFREMLMKHNFSIDLYYNRLIQNIYNSLLELSHRNCRLTFSEKIEEVKKIKEDEHVKQLLANYHPNGVREQTLLNILRFKNNRMVYSISWVLNILKNKSIF